MSNDEWAGSASGRAVNQFGTPVGQFGAPAGQLGTPGRPAAPQPFGAAQSFGAAPPFGAAQPYGTPPPPRRRSGAGLLVAAAVVAVVVAAGLLVRAYVFPDLSKPIALPRTVVGVPSMGATGTEPVTLQSKDREGRATAIGVYADDPTRPQTMVVVTAGRVKDLNTSQITEATTTSGKVTCTDNIDAATLLRQAGAAAGPNAAAMRAFTAGAACWRTGRHLTVLAVALTADGAAQAAARQSVTEAWDAV